MRGIYRKKMESRIVSLSLFSFPLHWAHSIAWDGFFFSLLVILGVSLSVFGFLFPRPRLHELHLYFVFVVLVLDVE